MGKWETDAERLSDLSEKNIFLNEDSRRFLKQDRIFWVISAKGMGKTLLLRYKKQLLEESSDHSGIIIIPENQPLDYVRLPSYLKKEQITFLEDSNFWKDLWEISIVISIFFYFPRKEMGTGKL